MSCYPDFDTCKELIEKYPEYNKKYKNFSIYQWINFKRAFKGDEKLLEKGGVR